MKRLIRKHGFAICGVFALKGKRCRMMNIRRRCCVLFQPGKACRHGKIQLNQHALAYELGRKDVAVIS